MYRSDPIIAKTIVAVIMALALMMFVTKLLFGSEIIDANRLADAIFWAEGGPNTNHPYGILKKYKVTTPRQAAINTINHALKDWDGSGDFISFLGSRYCPVGAANDPAGLNKNWIKNVTYLYNPRSD